MAITLVSASDWNPVIQKMRSVLSTPNGTTTNLGYNTTYSANDVAAGNVISGAQWNNLRADINKAYTLQTGANSDLTARDSSYLITQTDLTTISARVDTSYNNRLSVSNGQLTYQGVLYANVTGSWASYITYTGYIDWGSNAAFRGFFNGGGRIVISASRSGGSGTSQNQGWTNLTTNMGSICIARDSMYQSGQSWNGTINKANGIYGGQFTTTLNQAFIIYDQDTNYTSNYFQVLASLDSNDLKVAKRINLTVNIIDNHAPVAAGPDYVDGNFNNSVDIYYPFGNNWNTAEVTSSGVA